MSFGRTRQSLISNARSRLLLLLLLLLRQE